MSEAERPERPNNFLGPLSDALFLALVTVGAYWVSFCYEAGYLSGFGLPIHVVQISLSTTLVVALTLSGAAYVLFTIINFALLHWPEHPAIQEKVFRIGLMLLFPLWQLLIYGPRRKDWFVYMFPLALIALFEFIWPFLVYPNRGSLRERFIADETAEAPVRNRLMFPRIHKIVGTSGSFVLLLSLVGSLCAHRAGQAAAETQKEYFVFADAPDFAVVRMYSDTIIRVQFDRKTKAVQPRVIVRKIGTEKVMLIRDADLGPLEKQIPKVPTKPQNHTKTPM